MADEPVLDRAGRREIAMAVILAGITGYVDAISFTRLFTVFPANQSGNVVLLGIAIGDGDAGQAWRPALAIVAFVVGVMLGMALVEHMAPRLRMPTLLSIETVLLAIVAGLAGDIAVRTPPLGGGREAVVLACAGIAMGVQTDVIRRAAQVGVWTTFTTGAMVNITDELTDVVVHVRRPTPRGRRLVTVLGAVVVVYVLGAAAGQAMVDAWGYALWLTVVCSGALAIWVALVPPAVAPVD